MIENMSPAQLVGGIVCVLMSAAALVVVTVDELNGRPVDPTMGNVLIFVLGFISSSLGVHIGAQNATKGVETGANISNSNVPTNIPALP